MRFAVTSDDGAAIDFECADNLVSRWTCGEILEGRTYPWLPFVPDVEVIVDAGANCGAATVYFAHHRPGAEVHAFEPGRRQRAILERNVAALPGVSVHPFGLHSVDQSVRLFAGAEDSGLSSIYRSDDQLNESEPVELRSAIAWAAEADILRIDVLKLDVEGCEVEVLRSLVPLLPTVKVLYVEYDSRAARRQIEEIVSATHELYSGLVFLDQGEITYLRSDLADLPEAKEHLATRLRAAVGGA